MGVYEGKGRPRVLILADQKDWAYDFDAQSLKRWLAPRYRITIRHANQKPDLSKEKFDLLYVLFYGDEHHRQFGFPRDKVIKQVSSHRWAYDEKRGKLSPSEMAQRYLEDACIVTTSSRRLLHMFQAVRPEVYYCPHGIELDAFSYRGRRKGPMTIGWVGHPGDFLKGLREILIPACEGRFDLRYTDGTWSFRRVKRFYHEIDVLAISSIAEGDPRPLMEGMLCGCFPVSTDVGIVPELVNPGFNGMIVERSPEAFREAFSWCENNLHHIRRVAPYSARMCSAVRGAERVAGRTGDVLDLALGLRSSLPADVRQEVGLGVPIVTSPSENSLYVNADREDAYVENAQRLERGILPLLPVDRDSAIVDMTGENGDLIRFLLENGYSNVGVLGEPAGGNGGPGSQVSRVSPSDLGASGPARFDALIFLDIGRRIIDDALRHLLASAYSSLRDEGRILLHIGTLENTRSSARSLVSLLRETGFHAPSLHSAAPPVSAMEGIKRMASTILGGNRAKHGGGGFAGELVAWATKTKN